MCWGQGERETQEVSLAVKNSPYAIWANRCKAEWNKIQVWEITLRVWGGKIISVFCFCFLSTLFVLLFDINLYFCLLHSWFFFYVHVLLFLALFTLHLHLGNTSGWKLKIASLLSTKEEGVEARVCLGVEVDNLKCITHFWPPAAPNTHQRASVCNNTENTNYHISRVCLMLLQWTLVTLSLSGMWQFFSWHW